MLASSHIQLKAIRLVLAIGVLIMAAKFTAYYFTSSTAILTDALESIINVLAGTFALFSLSYASRPKDLNHPYGHGKVEFISAGFEGGLILMAGTTIVVKALLDLVHPPDIENLDMGIFLSAIAGGLNYFMGKYLVKVGAQHRSITLVAEGKHLLTDTITSVGLVLGVAIIYITGWIWIDSVLAIMFAFFIFITGYKLVRKSLSGLMDETDTAVVSEIVNLLENNRKPQWIDLHNLRVLQYGSSYHVDCHITMPWFNTLADTHAQLDEIELVLKQAYPNEIEVFVHPDPCLPSSCNVCAMKFCNHRHAPQQKHVKWDVQNTLLNKKHDGNT
jgi:cation diffusion facilitator family transporter